MVVFANEADRELEASHGPAVRCTGLGALLTHYKQLVQRTMIHKCSGYCLRACTCSRAMKHLARAAADVRHDASTTLGRARAALDHCLWKCRFGFGYTVTKAERIAKGRAQNANGDVNPSHPQFPRSWTDLSSGDTTKFEGSWDHPRLVQHVRVALLAWNGNVDTQPLLDNSLLAVQRYVCAYSCKGAASTDEYIEVYRKLLANASEDASVRQLAQQLLLKIVGMVDVPAAAADLILSGGKLYRCSRNFSRIGLSGFRALRDEPGQDGTVTCRTPLDRYLEKSVGGGLSLWEWATVCQNASQCSCGRRHVPVFTGKPQYASWPLSEDFALGQLIVHAPGGWKRLEDLRKPAELGLVRVRGGDVDAGNAHDNAPTTAHNEDGSPGGARAGDGNAQGADNARSDALFGTYVEAFDAYFGLLGLCKRGVDEAAAILVGAAHVAAAPMAPSTPVADAREAAAARAPGARAAPASASSPTARQLHHQFAMPPSDCLPTSPPSPPASPPPPPSPQPPPPQPQLPQNPQPQPASPPTRWKHAQPLSKARLRRLCAVADLVREAASSEARKADQQSKAVDRTVRRAAGAAFIETASQDGHTPANETGTERQQRLDVQPHLRAAAAAGHDGREAAVDDAAAFVDIVGLPLAPATLDRHAASLAALRDGNLRDARADRTVPGLAEGAWFDADSPSNAGHWLPKLVEQTKRRALLGAARGDEAASTVINAAPTGAAATLLWQGRTVHSLVSPPQIKSADRDKAQMSDYPLSSDKMAVLRAALGTESSGLRTAVLNLDERSMFDHELAGWTSWRLGEATGLTHQRGYTCGGIPVVLWFGDLGQLPKSGEGLHAKLKAGQFNPASVTGSFLYQQGFSGAVVLNQTMRQAADQQELLERLLAIREGRVTQAHVDAIKARLESAQSDEYRADFRRRRVMTLYEKWADATLCNMRELKAHCEAEDAAAAAEDVAAIEAARRSTRAHHVFRLPSSTTGRRPRGEDKEVGQIPEVCLVAVGMRVVLTRNQGLPSFMGLNNGAMGTVVGPLYAPGAQATDLPIAIVVDWPQYSGPAWDPQHPTWVPIPLNTSHDQESGATRTGFPLKPGYATVIHKSQGMSIGDGKLVERLRLVLGDGIDMEKTFLGLLYVACSRVERDSYWVLCSAAWDASGRPAGVADPGVSPDRLNYSNRHPQMRGRLAEDARLHSLHAATADANPGLDDLETFKGLLQQVDEWANDGLRDSESWAGLAVDDVSLVESNRRLMLMEAANRGLPAELPLAANARQRMLLGICLRALLCLRRIMDQRARGAAVEAAPAPVRLIVQGTAGVGKTFVINSLTRLAARLFPSGARFAVPAAVPFDLGVPGGGDDIVAHCGGVAVAVGALGGSSGAGEVAEGHGGGNDGGNALQRQPLPSTWSAEQLRAYCVAHRLPTTRPSMSGWKVADLKVLCRGLRVRDIGTKSALLVRVLALLPAAPTGARQAQDVLAAGSRVAAAPSAAVDGAGAAHRGVPSAAASKVPRKGRPTERWSVEELRAACVAADKEAGGTKREMVARLTGGLETRDAQNQAGGSKREMESSLAGGRRTRDVQIQGQAAAAAVVAAAAQESAPAGGTGAIRVGPAAAGAAARPTVRAAVGAEAPAPASAACGTARGAAAVAAAAAALAATERMLIGFGIRPLWMISAPLAPTSSSSSCTLLERVVLRARVVDFLNQGHFVAATAQWLRDLGADVTFECGGNRPLQLKDACAMAAASSLVTMARAGSDWSAVRVADVSGATSHALVRQLNMQLDLAPRRKANAPALAPHAVPEARILDDWELGRVLDALRPPGQLGGGAHNSYLDWCSVIGVDQFAEMVVGDVRSVGRDRTPVRRFVALANGLRDGRNVLGPAHWISVVYDVEYGGEGMADAGVGGKRARE